MATDGNPDFHFQRLPTDTRTRQPDETDCGHRRTDDVQYVVLILAELHHVVPLASLHLRCGSEHQPETDRGDEIDRHFHLVLICLPRDLAVQAIVSCGTQWSQNATRNLPAAPAVRMCTSGEALAAAL